MSFSDPGFQMATGQDVNAKETMFKTGNFNVNVEFENHTGKTLYIKNIRNAVFAIQPETNVERVYGNHDHLAVHITYELTDINNIVETKRIIEAVKANGGVITEETERLYKEVQKLFAENPSTTQRRRFVFKVTRIIDASVITKSAAIIQNDTSLVITVYREQAKRPHPYSPQGLHEVDMENEKQNFGMTGVFIKVVDNEMIASNRYFYAGKQLISVPSTIDKNRESGVYVTVATGAADLTVNRESSFYTFTEAEERLGLYKSQELALTHGNPELIKETEIARHKSREMELKNEALSLKQKLNNQDVELAEIKRQNTVLEEALKAASKLRDFNHDNAKAERDIKNNKRKNKTEKKAMKEKQKYEERSAKRKDTSEIIKFIPTIITGAIAVGMLFFKLFEKRSAFA